MSGIDLSHATAFDGAKIALVAGQRLLAYRRDALSSIPWPGYWDLPGGGREGAETPLACALRELHEEFALTLDPARVTHAQSYLKADGQAVWFFGARGEAGLFDRVRFGSEGAYWRVMEVAEFLGREDAVPHLRVRLATWLTFGKAGRLGKDAEAP